MPTPWSDLPTLEAVLGDNRIVKVPCCGRETNADMSIDLRGVPPGIVMRWKYTGTFLRVIDPGDPEIGIPPTMEEIPIMCDSCRERMIREGLETRRMFYQQLGAPVAILDRVEAYERARARGGRGRLSPGT